MNLLRPNSMWQRWHKFTCFYFLMLTLSLCLRVAQQYAIFRQAAVLCGGEKTANRCLTATAMTKRANFPFLCLFLPRRGFVVDVSTPGRKPGWYVYFHLELLASPRTLNNAPTQTKPNNVCFFFLHMSRRKDDTDGASARRWPKSLYEFE